MGKHILKMERALIASLKVKRERKRAEERGQKKEYRWKEQGAKRTQLYRYKKNDKNIEEKNRGKRQEHIPEEKHNSRRGKHRGVKTQV